MSKGPFNSLNIYYPYGLRKSGFKNTIGNRPLLRSENFYLVSQYLVSQYLKNFLVSQYLKLQKNFFLVGLSFTGISFVYCLFGGP